MMSIDIGPKTNPNQTMIYQIRIKGHLSPQWNDYFSDLTVTLEENGDTTLTGPVVDQAALHGLIKKVRDLGMELVSVIPIESGQAEASNINQQFEVRYDSENAPSKENPEDKHEGNC